MSAAVVAKVMGEKRRIETVLGMFPEAVIGFDGAQKLLFVNPIAEKLLGLSQSSAVGKYAPDLALYNDLLRTLLKRDTDTDPLRIFADDRESFFQKEIYEVYDPKGETSIGRFIVLKNTTLIEEKNTELHNERIALYHALKRHFSALETRLSQLGQALEGTQKAALDQLMAENAAFLATIESEIV